jgi:hypothetical protein
MVLMKYLVGSCFDWHVWLLLLLFLVFEGYANVTHVVWAASLEMPVKKPLTLTRSGRLTEGRDVSFVFCRRILSRSFRNIQESFRELYINRLKHYGRFRDSSHLSENTLHLYLLMMFKGEKTRCF